MNVGVILKQGELTWLPGKTWKIKPVITCCMDGTTWTHSSSDIPAPPVPRLSRLPGDTVATRSSHTILSGGAAEDPVIRLSIGRPSIGGPVLMNKWTLLDPPGLSTGSDDGLARLRAPHGSSEGHAMLKRNDKYHSKADDVPIPKMYFFYQNRSMAFFKNCTFVSDTIFFSLAI